MSTPAPEWVRSLRVIGFDLDQTLYPKSSLIDEKIQGYLYERIADYRKVSLDEARRLFTERYQEGAGLTGSQTLADLGLPNASELVQEALEHADIASVLMPDPQIVSLLQDLNTRFESVDLITGSGTTQVEKKLAALAIPREVFKHCITADEASKSDGTAYHLWLSFYPHLSPEQLLYVGDRVRSDHDIPSELGIHTALVYRNRADPALPIPQLISPADLRALLLS